MNTMITVVCLFLEWRVSPKEDRYILPKNEFQASFFASCDVLTVFNYWILLTVII